MKLFSAIIVSLSILIAASILCYGSEGGTLMEMGYNEFGQLGDGTTTDRSTPLQVATGVVQADGGVRHSLFVKADGTLWAMGQNSDGQLGDSTHIDRNTPVQVANNVSLVSAGYYYSLFVKTDGSLWAMGNNVAGQLGDGTTIGRYAPVLVATDVAQASGGFRHSLFLKTDGTLWAMGWNYWGQLGDGTTTDRSTPIQVDAGVSLVFAGASHSLFVKTDGTLWAMGDNRYSQLGDGTTNNRTTPIQVATDVSLIAAGSRHSLFVKADATLWAMGYNEFGQLGDGTTNNRDTPIQVDAGVSQATGGAGHNMFVKSDGSLWAIGYNYYGQLGDGTTTDRSTPVQIATNISQITAGYYHSLFIKEDTVPDSVDLTLTISNVDGGAVGLEGIWRVDLYDPDGEPAQQYYSPSPTFEMTLPGGTYSAKAFFLYDDGLAIWEYWGEKTFSLVEESESVAFTRNMPWLSTIGPYKPVLSPGDSLSVSCTLKNDLFTSVEVVLEGQIGAGNIMSSNKITIPANSSAPVTFQFNDLPDSGVWPLRYWVKAIPPGESAFTFTDHSVINGYLSYESSNIQGSEYVSMDYVDSAGSLWQIGFDYKDKSNEEWFFDPQNTFKNIKYYKNGARITPSDLELQMLLDRVAHYFSSFYPAIFIGEEFDTSYGIWRQPCGFSWACALALIDFDDYERKTIYKEILWEAVTCRNHPYLNTEYRVPANDAYTASSLSLKVASTIDEIYSRYSSAIGVGVKALNRFRKLLYIAEMSETDSTLAEEINNKSKSLGKTVSMLKIAGKVGDVSMHAVQNIVMMDFLAATGFAENRIATIKEAYNFVKNNIESQVDPVLEQAILEMESEFDNSLNSLGDAVVSGFLQVVWDDLGDPNYVKQKLIDLAAGSKLAKKLVGKVAKNFNLSKVAVATAVMDGIKGVTTVMELGDNWRRIILSGMLSKVTTLYAQNDPAWLAAAYPTNNVLTADALMKHQVRDVYDLQSVFAFEYLSRGLGLVEPDWNSVLQDAIDSTLDQASSPPYTYPINYASTAVVFGQQVGLAANNLVYGDSLEAARDMLLSIIDNAEKRNRVINEWAQMMAKSQRKAMPWIPLLLLDK